MSATEARWAYEELHDAITAEGPTPCQSSDPELWFPEAARADGPAVALCRTVCPVRDQCLAYALAADERFGIWGGTTPGQRRPRD